MNPFGALRHPWLRWPPLRAPSILDLWTATAFNIDFDHNGDGMLTRADWGGNGAALLDWDRNSNGLIDKAA
ncbi:MAG: hypothetical protein GXZ10_10895 [Gammaproteobacteria bacterium]|nr:hypothetical protein [Gammaproteobacteria bacterium]